MWVDQIRGYCSCENETRVVSGKMEKSVDVQGVDDAGNERNASVMNIAF